MKKKIVAVLAAIAAVFGFGFASNAAMADDYGSTGVVSGSVATYTFENLTPNTAYDVYADDTYVESVSYAAYKNFGSFTSDANGVLKVKFTLKAGVKAGTVIKADLQKDGAVVASATATVPSTGEGEASNNELGNTGAAIAPYAVAVALLAAAGVAVFAVRKTNAR